MTFGGEWEFNGNSASIANFHGSDQFSSQRLNILFRGHPLLNLRHIGSYGLLNRPIIYEVKKEKHRKKS